MGKITMSAIRVTSSSVLLSLCVWVITYVVLWYPYAKSRLDAGFAIVAGTLLVAFLACNALYILNWENEWQ